jgi:hypothetical protein
MAGGQERRGWRRQPLRIVLLLVLAVVAALVVVQQLGVRDLRRLERAYIATRETTACATQALTPGAFSTDQSKLTETVQRLVTQASVEVTATRDRYRHRRHALPLPHLRSAEQAIADAMDAQVALYDAMVHDPAHSEDLLHALGRRNTTVEHRLAKARSLLAVGETPQWKRRFICDHG